MSTSNRKWLMLVCTLLLHYSSSFQLASYSSISSGACHVSASLRPLRSIKSRSLAMAVPFSNHPPICFYTPSLELPSSVQKRAPVLSPILQGVISSAVIAKLPISFPSIKYIPALEVHQTFALCIGSSVGLASFYRHDIKQLGLRLASILLNIKIHISKMMSSRFIEQNAADDLKLASAQGRKEANRITFIGGLLNIALALIKLVVGLRTGSAAMLAEAGHSISDIISDTVTLVTLQVSALPPDRDHLNGHGRFEPLGCIFISLFIISAAFALGDTAVESFVAVSNNPLPHKLGISSAWFLTTPPSSAVTQTWANFLSKQCSSGESLALVVSLVSMLLKEQLFRVTARIAKKCNSSVLLANAWHHRSDALCSLVALIGIAGSASLGLRLLDPIAAMVVAGLLAANGIEMGWSALVQLSDTHSSGGGI